MATEERQPRNETSIVKRATQLHLVPRLRIHGAAPPFTLRFHTVFLSYIMANLQLHLVPRLRMHGAAPPFTLRFHTAFLSNIMANLHILSISTAYIQDLQRINDIAEDNERICNH
jgi:hypothetical protein